MQQQGRKQQAKLYPAAALHRHLRTCRNVSAASTAAVRACCSSGLLWELAAPPSSPPPPLLAAAATGGTMSSCCLRRLRGEHAGLKQQAALFRLLHGAENNSRRPALSAPRAGLTRVAIGADLRFLIRHELKAYVKRSR